MVVAIAIDGAEMIGLLADVASELWQFAAPSNENSTAVGAAVIVLFGLIWLLAALIWHNRAELNQQTG